VNAVASDVASEGAVGNPLDCLLPNPAHNERQKSDAP
jgi:hypothetical protein